MPLMPKRVKYRKTQRGTMKGKATRGNRVVFGEYGLQALGCAWVTAQQIEAGRLAVMHHLKREGKLTIRIFPHKSVTARAAETRMGKGKGDVAYWTAVVKPGTVMYELSGVTHEKAITAFARVAAKMPVRCRLVQRSVHA